MVNLFVIIKLENKHKEVTMNLEYGFLKVFAHAYVDHEGNNYE